MARLATLVPRPRVHLTRYYGVFAPHSRWRARVIDAVVFVTGSPYTTARTASSLDPMKHRQAKCHM